MRYIFLFLFILISVITHAQNGVISVNGVTIGNQTLKFDGFTWTAVPFINYARVYGTIENPTNQTAELGSVWINTLTNRVWMLTENTLPQTSTETSIRYNPAEYSNLSLNPARLNVRGQELQNIPIGTDTVVFWVKKQSSSNDVVQLEYFIYENNSRVTGTTTSTSIGSQVSTGTFDITAKNQNEFQIIHVPISVTSAINNYVILFSDSHPSISLDFRAGGNTPTSDSYNGAASKRVADAIGTYPAYTNYTVAGTGIENDMDFELITNYDLPAGNSYIWTEITESSDNVQKTIADAGDFLPESDMVINMGYYRVPKHLDGAKLISVDYGFFAITGPETDPYNLNIQHTSGAIITELATESILLTNPGFLHQTLDLTVQEGDLLKVHCVGSATSVNVEGLTLIYKFSR